MYPPPALCAATPEVPSPRSPARQGPGRRRGPAHVRCRPGGRAAVRPGPSGFQQSPEQGTRPGYGSDLRAQHLRVRTGPEGGRKPRRRWGGAGEAGGTGGAGAGAPRRPGPRTKARGRAALTEVQELLHGERGRREARVEVHLARDAALGHRAGRGGRVRGEAAAGARARAGRGGSAQQPRQPHAEPAGEPSPRARRPLLSAPLRSARAAGRAGRGEPRGRGSVSNCHAAAAAPRAAGPGPGEGGRRGARGAAPAGAGPAAGGRWAPPRLRAGPSASGKAGEAGALSRPGGVLRPLPAPFGDGSHLPAASASARRLGDGPARGPAGSGVQKVSPAMPAPPLPEGKQPRRASGAALAEQGHRQPNGEPWERGPPHSSPTGRNVTRGPPGAVSAGTPGTVGSACQGPLRSMPVSVPVIGGSPPFPDF